MLTDIDDAQVARCLSRARKVQERSRRAEDEVGHVTLERDYLQACIDHLPTPIFFKNVEGVYVGCNSAFAEYLGLPLETILGASVYDVAPAEIARRYQAADDALFEGGGVQVYESKVCHSNGDMRFVEFQKAVIKSRNQGVYGIAGAILDITDRKRLETQLIEAAERDPLTNAYNRRKFFQLAEDAAEWARNGSRPVSVAIIDVDQFKLINDRLGHSEGDNVLCTVSQVLEAASGEDNIVARAGGEEFYALFPGLLLEDAAAIADGMRGEVERFLPYRYAVVGRGNCQRWPRPVRSGVRKPGRGVETCRFRPLSRQARGAKPALPCRLRRSPATVRSPAPCARPRRVRHFRAPAADVLPPGLLRAGGSTSRRRARSCPEVPNAFRVRRSLRPSAR